MTESNKKFVNTLIVKHHDKLHGYLTKRLSNSSFQPLDVAQETYLRILRMKDTKSIREPHAYLYKVASHVITEFWLKEKKHKELPNELEHYYENMQQDSSHEHQLHLEEKVRQLEKLMDKLPPMYKSVLFLRKRDGLSHKEIAKKLNISTHTVKKYMYLALAWCKKNAATIN